MHHVLSIPELIANIFSFSDQADNIRNASVCKAWCKPALDATWRVVSDVNMAKLFNILTPLEGEKGEKQKYLPTLGFARTPTAKDWVNFDKYRRRVRHLEFGLVSHHLRASGYSLLHVSTFNAIARTRITHDIFPNLQSYTFASGHRHAVLFMHSGVKDVHIKLQSGDDYLRLATHPLSSDNGNLLRTMAAHMPNIADLTITVENDTYTEICKDHSETSSVQKDEEHLCKVVSSLTSLRTLNLPRFWMTTSIMEAAATLPSLTTIQVNFSDPGNPLDVVHWHPLLLQEKLEEEKLFRRKHAVIENPTVSPPLPPIFPSLTLLVVTARYDHVRDFLARMCRMSSDFPNRLQILAVLSPIMESRESLRSLIEILGEHYLNIRTLYFLPAISSPHMPNAIHSIFPPPTTSWTLRNLLPFRVTLSDIQPLFKLKQLRILDIQHHLPAAFSLSDLEIIGKEFYKLTNLALFSKPCPLRVANDSHNEYWGIFIDKPHKWDEGVAEGQGPMDIDDGGRILGLRETLRTLGRTCPNLQTLGVYVCVNADLEVNDLEDGFDEDFGDPNYSTTNSNTRGLSPYFQSLNSIHFGSSPIVGYEPRPHHFSLPSPHDGQPKSTVGASAKTALILSEYLPRRVKVKAGVSWCGERFREDSWDSAYMRRIRMGGRRNGFGESNSVVVVAGAGAGGLANPNANANANVNAAGAVNNVPPVQPPAPPANAHVDELDEDEEERYEEAEYNPEDDVGRVDWMEDGGGHAIPDDVVLETNESRGPLVTGLEPLAKHLGVDLHRVRDDGGFATGETSDGGGLDESSGVYRTMRSLWKEPVPAVFLDGWSDQATRLEVESRKKMWGSVKEVLGDVITLRENERRKRLRLPVEDAGGREVEGPGMGMDVDSDDEDD
ncbi:hypothetical protein BDN72DRAFT_960306 [Pluteus cervinus]|uniref:Uncharacterized protein n=1 Tax=Pluteus cervinus TaxID=181527 RepID=A0ACD3ARW3_9AGAR|nr:hypothetical protein BDN72DRAFT_960306 [Pluteus cervinus]